MTTSSIPPINALILLGGLSSRMGIQKHLLQLPDSQSLLSHTYSILRTAFPDQNIYLSVRDKAQIPKSSGIRNLQILLDSLPSHETGPAAGLLAAHEAASSASWLVVAVDFPLLVPESIKHLVNAHTTTPVTCYVNSEGILEPLFAIWTPHALEHLHENVRRGRLGPTSTIRELLGLRNGKLIRQHGEGAESQELPLGVVQPKDSSWLRNTNTPEEWEAAMQIWQQRQSDLAERHAPESSPNPHRHHNTAVTYDKALSILQQTARLLPPKVVTVSTSQSVNRIAATAMTSACALPRFANSAMDGYAVHSNALVAASTVNPISLRVVGSIAAGDSAPHPDEWPEEFFDKDAAWEIMTGAPFPAGFDACIRVEDVPSSFITSTATRTYPYDIEITKPPQRNQNRREIGEDMPFAHPILKAGTKITPTHVMVATAVGVSEVEVYGPLSVGIISTGNEIIDPTVPSAIRSNPLPSPSLSPPLTPTETKPQSLTPITTIPNSNAPYLLTDLASLPVLPHHVATLPDTPSLLIDTLKHHLPHNDILITTGGVSMGKHDYLPDCLRKSGVEVLFHGVEMKPGRPVLAGRWEGVNEKGERRKCFVLALPGTPSGVVLCSKVLLEPFVREVFGMEPLMPIRAKLRRDQRNGAKKHGGGGSECGGCHISVRHGRPNIRVHSLVRASTNSLGEIEAKIVRGHGMRAMLESNGWAVLSGGADSGDAVDVFLNSNAFFC